MKTILTTIFLLGVTLQLALAQSANLSDDYKKALVEQISSELENRYVFPEKAAEITQHLKAQEAKGSFSEADNWESFAEQLTEEIYEVVGDKHIIVSQKQEAVNSESQESDPLESWIDSRMEERMYFRRYNANFKMVEKLEDNIGYLDLRGFYGLDYGRKFADAAIEMLATSDAIIIDLRNNSGGRGDMVDYMLSHFFEEPIITGVSRKRSGDEFVDRVHKTQVRKGKRIITDTPVFILTSAKTFSAAEAFSYPMQVYDRATFIGETTKGGANAGDLISLDDHMEIFIPDVAGMPHPVSGTTFEGIGIIPDVKVPSNQAFDMGLELAAEAAKDYKKTKDAEARETLIALNGLISNYEGENDQKIVDAYLDCRAKDLIFEEWELNSLGYQLLNGDSPKTAQAVLKANTVLYPHSANAFDSYAEVLLKNGQKSEAISNYEKAVEIAEANGSSELTYYQENLKKAKE